MMKTALRRLTLALTLSGILGAPALAGGQQDTPPAKPASPYVGAANTGGALGQLERMAGGSVHTGVGFDGRERIPILTAKPIGPRSPSDVFVKPVVNLSRPVAPPASPVIQKPAVQKPVVQKPVAQTPVVQKPVVQKR